MVHLEIGQSNTGLLAIAAELAERLDAGVIGIAACQPMQIVEGDGYEPTVLMGADSDDIEEEIKKAEAEFRDALQTSSRPVEWRSTITLGPLADYLAGEAGRADLVVTSASWRQAKISDFVMQLGRAALIVPAEASTLNLDHVLVAWKDTREARRATLDALALLKKAARVTIVEIADEKVLSSKRAHLDDIATWLKTHGICAETLASSSTGNNAMRLKAIAREQGTDLIVAGAYGHSRLREFVLGGVTHDLLLCADLCSLVSH